MKTIANTLRAACLLAAACTLAACSTLSPPPGNTLGTITYTMQPGDSVPVGPNGPTLRYDRADDSRCPPDVQCIWAGTIVYEFTLIGPFGTEEFTLAAERPHYDALLDPALHITLGAFEPPPVPPSGAPKPVYPVTITVERDN
jgi:hypothetical protein